MRSQSAFPRREGVPCVIVITLVFLASNRIERIPMMRTKVLLLALLLSSAAVAQQAACPPAAPVQLSSPADNATLSSPVTFSWNPLNGATAYRIWVIIDGAPATVLDRTTNPTATDP